MGTTITFTVDTLSIVMTGDGVYVGCTYDRLDGWYDVAKVDLGIENRPNAAGGFAPQQTFPGPRPISVEGQFFGASRAEALLMRENLAALYNDGRSVVMTVADDLRTTSREVLVSAIEFPWTIHQEFEFTIDAMAADPRRYDDDASSTVSTGLAAPGTGFVWPAVWPINWGTIGVSGKLIVANPGNTETMSTYTVTDGEMPDGFEIVNVDTGERLTYIGPVALGTTIVLDTATRTALINGTGAGSRFLVSPQWWAIPPRATREIQFLARGGVTGSPTLTVSTRPAYH